MARPMNSSVCDSDRVRLAGFVPQLSQMGPATNHCHDTQQSKPRYTHDGVFFASASSDGHTGQSGTGMRSVHRPWLPIVPLPGVFATWAVKGDEGLGSVRDQRNRLTAGPAHDRAVGEACSLCQCGCAVWFNTKLVATSHQLLRAGGAGRIRQTHHRVGRGSKANEARWRLVRHEH